MKDLDKMRRALVAAAQGRTSEGMDDETAAAHAQFVDEVAEQKARGLDTAVPNEWPDLSAADLARIKAMQAQNAAKALEAKIIEEMQRTAE